MSTRDTLEVLYKKVSFGWWGLVGSGVVLITSLISAITYIGRQGEYIHLLIILFLSLESLVFHHSLMFLIRV
jgi:hypothetical protein